MNEWKLISSAPNDSTSIQVKMKDGTIHKDAHWASDMSGENQPIFEGWFVPSTGSWNYEQIDTPKQWQAMKEKANE